MTDRPTVTAAIIAQNEADRLAALVAQLEWADQIVVIDGGSRDGTAEVAAAHGCDVVTRPLDSFANQRNAALELARCDWVLSIDADERPAGGLVEEIRSRLGQNGYVGYRVAIRSEIFGRRFRWSGTQLDRPVRLVRRGYGRWVGAVHEVLAVDGRVGRLRGWLEHRTLPDLDAFLAKVHRYSELAAQAAVAAGRPPGPFDRWLHPFGEVARRLVLRQGYLDGPQGWAFCLLSGLAAWVLADRHRRYWHDERPERGREAGMGDRR